MYKVGSQAVEIFASRISIPIKAGYCIAVVPYAFMECCPVRARMCDAGGPFLLEGLRVMRHTTFIGHLKYLTEFTLVLFVNLKFSGPISVLRFIKRGFASAYPASRSIL